MISKNKCKNGHKYKKKFNKCPYCEVDIDLDIVRNNKRSKKNIDLNIQGEIIDIQKKNQNKTILKIIDSNKTVLKSTTSKAKKITQSKKKIIGWLVCIEGNNIYNDYKFNTGINTFGIDFDGKFNCDNSNKLLALKYFSIECELNNLYLSKKGYKDIKVNDILINTTKLKRLDIIVIGKNKFILELFMEGKYKW